MKLTEQDDRQIRKYLLGELSEQEQEQFEERLFDDDELFEQLALVEDELIDDYALEALSESERERFDNYFLVTPERRRKLRLATTMKEYAIKPAPVIEPVIAHKTEKKYEAEVVQKTEKPRDNKSSWWARLFYPSPLKLAAATVAVLAIGVGVWLVFFYQSDIDKGLAALNKAYAQQRPLEARITGFDHAPFAVMRGNEKEKVDSTARNLAERLLFGVAETNPGPKLYYALGKLYLAERQYADAITQFEKALQDAPNNAQLHSDYGAALLEDAKTKERSGTSYEEAARGFEHLSRALELDDSLLEALFNRALCHEYMGLLPAAEQDWNSYLRKDQNSKWADEARQKLSSLQERSAHPLQDKEQIFQEFLDAFKARDDEKAWKLIICNREGKTIEIHIALKTPKE